MRAIDDTALTSSISSILTTRRRLGLGDGFGSTSSPSSSCTFLSFRFPFLSEEPSDVDAIAAKFCFKLSIALRRDPTALLLFVLLRVGVVFSVMLDFEFVLVTERDMAVDVERVNRLLKKSIATRTTPRDRFAGQRRDQDTLAVRRETTTRPWSHTHATCTRSSQKKIADQEHPHFTRNHYLFTYTRPSIPTPNVAN